MKARKERKCFVCSKKIKIGDEVVRKQVRWTKVIHTSLKNVHRIEINYADKAETPTSILIHKECEKEWKLHPQKWYKENWGVDVKKHKIPKLEAGQYFDNPIYIYLEKDVLPFKEE